MTGDKRIILALTMLLTMIIGLAPAVAEEELNLQLGTNKFSMNSENLAPGSEILYTLPLKNSGTIDITELELNTEYSDTNSSESDLSANEFARELKILEIKIGNQDLSGKIEDCKGGDEISIYDMANCQIISPTEIADQEKDFRLKVKLNEEAGNEFQGEGININFTFTASGSAEHDTSNWDPSNWDPLSSSPTPTPTANPNPTPSPTPPIIPVTPTPSPKGSTLYSKPDKGNACGIVNLTNTTYQPHSINWTWDWQNSTDGRKVYLNGVLQGITNVSHYNATNLLPQTTYQISIQANDCWVNHTAKTANTDTGSSYPLWGQSTVTITILTLILAFLPILIYLRKKRR